MGRCVKDENPDYYGFEPTLETSKLYQVMQEAREVYFESLEKDLQRFHNGGFMCSAGQFHLPKGKCNCV